MYISFLTDCATVSGSSELDYPRGAAFTNIKQLVPVNKVPIPPEIIENFSCILYNLENTYLHFLPPFFSFYIAQFCTEFLSLNAPIRIGLFGC